MYDKWCDSDVEKFNLDTSQTSEKRKTKYSNSLLLKWQIVSSPKNIIFVWNGLIKNKKLVKVYLLKIRVYCVRNLRLLRVLFGVEIRKIVEEYLKEL